MHIWFTQLYPDKKTKLLLNLCDNYIAIKGKDIQLKDLFLNSEESESDTIQDYFIHFTNTEPVKLGVRDSTGRKSAFPHILYQREY